MKKITFLLLTILPLISLGQITNSTFDTDISGWATNGSASWNATEGNVAAGSAEFVATAGNNFRSSPNSQLSSDGNYLVGFWVKGAIGTTIKAQVFGWIGGNPSGPDLAMTGDWVQYLHTFTGCLAGINGNIRVVAVTDGTYYVDDAYFNIEIPAGSTFLTTNVVGSGTIAKTPNQPFYASTDVVSLEAQPETHWNFDSWSGDLTGSTNPSNITMDADKTVTANFAIDPTFDYAFTFNTDGDLEGWTTDPNLTVSSHTGGLITFSVIADQWSRMNLEGFPIPSANYNKVTITLQNETTNDELGFIVVGDPLTLTKTISTNDSSIKSYDFDLTQFTNWTGDVNFVKIRFADVDNTTNVGKPNASGTIIVDDIVFSYDPNLGSNDFEVSSFSVYPNPAKNILNINSKTVISKVQVYDITGKQVLETAKLNNNQLNVSSLKTGLYLLHIEDVNKNTAVKKLVIQ